MLPSNLGPCVAVVDVVSVVPDKSQVSNGDDAFLSDWQVPAFACVFRSRLRLLILLAIQLEPKLFTALFMLKTLL